MATSWAEFLRNHKDSIDYNNAALEVAELCKPEKDKYQVFTKMTEAQLLVVVSKSAVDGAAQYLFNFFAQRNLILK